MQSARKGHLISVFVGTPIFLKSGPDAKIPEIGTVIRTWPHGVLARGVPAQTDNFGPACVNDAGFAESYSKLEKKLMTLLRTLAATVLVFGSIAYAVTLSFAASTPNGGDIFREKCSMCHGIDGTGYSAIKTPNFTDAKWQAAHSDKELMNAIENGVKGTAMVSFKDKLSQQEMKAVLKYIRSLGAAKK